MKDIIVIPTYNEKENIAALAAMIFEAAPEVCVLVVDDNSPDGTAAAVNEFQQRYPNLSLLRRAKKDGLGRAYASAFAKVLQDPEIRTVATMDADLSHQPKYLPEMYARSSDDTVVVGSRYTKGGGTSGWELWRRVLSLSGNLYCRTITRLPIHDCTGGFNIIPAALLRQIDFGSMDMSGYAFLMELKYLLHRKGAKFVEVPIVFVNRAEGESKISSHIISEGVVAPWRMRFRRRSDST